MKVEVLEMDKKQIEYLKANHFKPCEIAKLLSHSVPIEKARVLAGVPDGRKVRDRGATTCIKLDYLANPMLTAVELAERYSVTVAMVYSALKELQLDKVGKKNNYCGDTPYRKLITIFDKNKERFTITGQKPNCAAIAREVGCTRQYASKIYQLWKEKNSL